MADIYLIDDIKNLLCNKFIVILGDSIQRTVYKDLVALLQTTEYLSCNNLKNKGEKTFRSDELLAGGTKGEMTNGIIYREVRQYLSEYFFVRFYFVTKCYNIYVRSILREIFTGDGPEPDIVIMNSCLWDISRYGPKGIDEYKANMEELFKYVTEIMPANTLFIWNTTLPISKMARGGVIIPDVEALTNRFRLDLLEANYFAHKLVLRFNLDLLDLHYYMRHHLHRRVEDGIHWDMTAHRRITNLLLTHIAEAWSHPLPGRVDPAMLKTMTNSQSRGREISGVSSVYRSGIRFFPQNRNTPQTFDDMNNNVPLMRDAFDGPMNFTSHYGANLPPVCFDQEHSNKRDNYEQQHPIDFTCDIDPAMMQDVMSVGQPNIRRGGGRGGQFFSRYSPY